MILRLLLALTALGTGSCLYMAPPPDNFVPMWPHGGMVQGMIGISRMSDDPQGAFADSGGVRDGSVTLPVLMMAVQHPLAGAHVQTGIEWGGTLGWERDVSYRASDIGGERIRHEDNLWIGDLFAGAFATLWFDGGARAFAGAGPLLHYGFVEYEFDDEGGDFVHVHESGFGSGVYARTGFEVPLWDNTWAGLQVRWLEADLDFNGDAGTFDTGAVQIMFSVTQGF